MHVPQSCLVPASPGVSSWTSQTQALSLSPSNLSKSLTEPSLIASISSCSFRVAYWKLEHWGLSLCFPSFILYLFISQLTMKHWVCDSWGCKGASAVAWIEIWQLDQVGMYLLEETLSACLSASSHFYFSLSPSPFLLSVFDCLSVTLRVDLWIFHFIYGLRSPLSLSLNSIFRRIWQHLSDPLISSLSM